VSVIVIVLTPPGGIPEGENAIATAGGPSASAGAGAANTVSPAPARSAFAAVRTVDARLRPASPAPGRQRSRTLLSTRGTVVAGADGKQSDPEAGPTVRRFVADP
jgi:hypothetical protein